MKFNSLKEKCEYYRSLTDYKLTPNNYVIVMLDGHCFSKMIKNKFEKPFDDTFIFAMNETAKYLVENIQGAKFAYTQSDEISILITDFDTPNTDSCFGYRLCKMQSIFASMAAAKFNQIMFARVVGSKYVWENDVNEVLCSPLYSFDCKVWTVPNANDAYAWFLYRQNDCVRNSKQQAAQTFIPHKDLMGKDTDTQIAMLKEKEGIDWNTDYTNGKKYGRLIYRELRHMSKEINGKMVEFDRNEWEAHDSEPFSSENNIIRKLVPQYGNN